MQYERRKKEQQPVLAVCYDFDHTLSPDDMQAQGYIQSLGYDVETFWRESNAMAAENGMDPNLAYMYKMVREAEGRLVLSRESLAAYGARVRLFAGVEDWFERIRAYGKAHGVIVEHYVLSSGLKEMIEGTVMAKNGAFERIYASSFYFDQGGTVRWPAQSVNYTNKTQFLFRIEKGVLDANDPAVNDSFAPSEMRVPFCNIVYIGDSATDIPCMRLVNSAGGHSVGVYDPATGDRRQVHAMMRQQRIRYFAPADYTAGAPLDTLLKAIIEKTAADNVLEQRHLAALRDAQEEELPALV